MTNYKSMTVSVLVFICVLGGCGGDSSENIITPVRVQKLKPEELDSPVRFTASVTPYTQLNLDFKVNGYVKEIFQIEGADGRVRDIQAGDPVYKDMGLALVDETEYIDKVIEATAQLAEAEASLQKETDDFKRAEVLYSTKSITAPDYERIRKDYQVANAKVVGAKAQLNEAELNLSYCRLTSPMNGEVLQRNIEIGSYVRQGTEGFVLADTSSVKVLFAIPDIMLGDVTPGQEMTIYTDSMKDIPFIGRITAIAPAASTRTRVFNVEVTVPNPDNLLKPGMIASLALNKGEPERQVILAPLNSIVRSVNSQNGFAVFIIEDRDGKTYVSRRDVQLGSVYGNMISIQEGVEMGEEIVVIGAQLIRDDQRVRIIP